MTKSRAAFCLSTGARLLSEQRVHDIPSACSAIDRLHERGCETVIMTSGDIAVEGEPETMLLIGSCPWGALFAKPNALLLWALCYMK